MGPEDLETLLPKNRAQLRYMGMAGVSAPNDLTFGLSKVLIDKKVGWVLPPTAVPHMGTGVFVTVTVPADKVEEFLKVRTVAGWSALALAFQSRWF